MAAPVVPLIIAGGALAAAGIGTAFAGGALGKSTVQNPQSSEFRNAITAAQNDANWAGQAYMGAATRRGPQLGNATMGSAASMDYATYDPSTINRSMEMESRGNQMSLAARLRDQMDGKGPSLAQEQLKLGMNQSLKAQLAAAGSARGGGVNAALAMRNIGNSADDMRAGMAGQATMARLQEQMAAQGQYGALTNAMRGQDMAWTQMQHQGGMMNVANRQQALGANASFAQQAMLANQAAANQYGLAQYQGDLNVMGMNDAQQRALLGYRGAMVDRALTAEERNVGFQMDQAKMDYQAAEDKRRRVLGFAGAMIGAGGSAMTMGASDERLKTNIKDGDKKLKSFYEALGTHSYKYRNPKLPGCGDGEYVSVMAQELEKTELGKHMVVEAEHGKMVDYAKGLGTMLAGQASLHKRLEKIEAALANKKARK